MELGDKAPQNVKDYSLRFAVYEVNGLQLEPPVEFNIAQLSISTIEQKNAIPNRTVQQELAGKDWSLTAYETGRMGVYPNEPHAKPQVFAVVGHPYYERPFTSRLVAVLDSE